jgi:hypothetical protein
MVLLGFILVKQSHMRLTVTDVAGKTVYEMPASAYLPGNHEMRIPTSGLNDGLYLLNIETDGIVTTRKLQVAR